MTPGARFMRMAIGKAREGVRLGQSPFGACIVKDAEVIACEHNVVWAATDITAHAEVSAIRAACRRLQSIDLSGSVIYSTCEPCPMCFAACHWARIRAIVFGCSIADAQAAGFHELHISNEDLRRAGASAVELVPGFLRDECQAVFDEFAAHPARRTY